MILNANNTSVIIHIDGNYSFRDSYFLHRFITALKSGDTGRASNLIGKAAIGLGFVTVILLIMLILIYHFKL